MMTPIAGIKSSFATKLSFVSRTCARKPLKACAFFDERSPADAPRPERAAACAARAPARGRRLALRAAVARGPAEAGQQNARDRLTRQALGPPARAREDEHALEVLALALAFKKVEQ